MSLSVEKIEAELLILSEQEQLKVFEFLRTRLQALIQKEALPKSEPNGFATFGGVLKNSSAFNGDPVEIQRRMRDEWN